MKIKFNDNKTIDRRPLVIFLMGPTASGKTSLAINLAQQIFKIKIISVDSGLIYRGMNIGTSKPSFTILKNIPHKLIDIRDPSACYSVADFYNDAIFEIKNIIKSNEIPLLVGGTMLYFKVLLQGLFHLPKTDQKIRNDLMYKAQKFGWISVYDQLKYLDPIASQNIHYNDHKRIIRALEIFLISGKTRTECRQNFNQLLKKCKILQFAVIPSSRDLLNNRIERRFYHMLDIGFQNEVTMLFNRPDLHIGVKPSISCIGYRQMWEYLSGNITYNQMILKGIFATRRLAKRQLTWLRKWPHLYWIRSDCLETAMDNILKVLLKELSCNKI